MKNRTKIIITAIFLGVIFAICPFWSLTSSQVKSPYDLANSAAISMRNTQSFECNEIIYSNDISSNVILTTTTDSGTTTQSEPVQTITPTQSESTVLYKRVNNLITFVEIYSEMSNDSNLTKKTYSDGKRLITIDNGHVYVSKASPMPAFLPIIYNQKFITDQKMTIANFC